MNADAVAGKIAELIELRDVIVDGVPLSIAPSAADVSKVILPLLHMLRDRPHTGARGLMGIAAPPGAGKSVLVGWLSAAAKVLGHEDIAFLSLDGYHLTNAELDCHSGVGLDGIEVSLRLLKGTLPTFDVERFLHDLRALKASRESVSLPAYSREVHDPVADAITIGRDVEWVIVEGNFLFLDAPVWRDIRDLFDAKVSLDAPDALLRRRLTARHARGGRSSVWIAAHFARTDGPNIDKVRPSLVAADAELRWAGGMLTVG